MATFSGHSGATPHDDIMISADKVWTVFGRGEDAFCVHQDLDLQVRRGEILTLIGGSGTGKTVLLRHIAGLTRPTRGGIRIDGMDTAGLSPVQAATLLGMLFQHGALYSAFNVLDNIAFALSEQRSLPAEVVRDAAMVKLRMVGLLPEHAQRMPADLSGGMIKRVALARALMMDPPLLLLDEPTAGLDPLNADAFCTLLRQLHQQLGLTAIIVTHDLDTLYALSTRVAVLADRRVIVTDTPARVVEFEHPFIKDFFLGERGRRAREPLPSPPDPAENGQEFS